MCFPSTRSFEKCTYSFWYRVFLFFFFGILWFCLFSALNVVQISIKIQLKWLEDANIAQRPCGWKQGISWCFMNTRIRVINQPKVDENVPTVRRCELHRRDAKWLLALKEYFWCSHCSGKITRHTKSLSDTCITLLLLCFCKKSQSSVHGAQLLQLPIWNHAASLWAVFLTSRLPVRVTQLVEIFSLVVISHQQFFIQPLATGCVFLWSGVSNYSWTWIGLLSAREFIVHNCASTGIVKNIALFQG